jgi:hypothetical protein
MSEKYEDVPLDTKAEFKTVKAIVEFLLKSDERCRNDDKWLTYRVFRYFTKIYIPFEDFSKIPAFETVKRTRAYIQNVEKKYIPTDLNVLAKRQRREQEVKQVLKEF